MFIYVMDAESRDKLIKSGYELLKGNDKNTMWVFVNKPERDFGLTDVSCVVSDILTF